MRFLACDHDNPADSRFCNRCAPERQPACRSRTRGPDSKNERLSAYEVKSARPHRLDAMISSGEIIASSLAHARLCVTGHIDDAHQRELPLRVRQTSYLLQQFSVDVAMRVNEGWASSTRGHH